MMGVKADSANSIGVCDSTETERRPLSSSTVEEDCADKCSSMYAGLSLENTRSVRTKNHASFSPVFTLFVILVSANYSCGFTGPLFGHRMHTECCATKTLSKTVKNTRIGSLNGKNELSNPYGNDFLATINEINQKEDLQKKSKKKKSSRSSPVFTNSPSLKESQVEQEKRRQTMADNLLHDDLNQRLHYSTVDETPVVAPKKKRGRPRKTQSTQKIVIKKTSGRSKSTSSSRKLKPDKYNLQKYYTTDLLTPSQEYSLGMKVRFMVLCEEVHRGLALHLGRNPTMAEWAYACGFHEIDDGFSLEKETPLEASIRPIGPSPTFNSNEFVGKSLAVDSGPGRGRGRAKKPPPISLAPYLDDTLLKFPNTTEEAPPPHTPVNTGTPHDFISIMLSAKESKQRMVECNMRLVVSIARRYHNAGVSIQDLVQEGSLGLMRATEKFQPAKGFKFSTYASWWIQQAVFRSIAYHSRTIRLPVHVHNFLNRVRRVRTQMRQDLGRAPTNEEIAGELQMTPKKYNKVLRLTRRTISLEMPKYQNNPKDLGHESEASLGDTINSNAAIKDDSSPEQTVDQGLFQSDLYKMLEILGEEEKKVISLRYGLEDGLTRTVTAVALQMRQTKSWVRSQECRALRKLRRPWYEKRLKEHQQSVTGR